MYYFGHTEGWLAGAATVLLVTLQIIRKGYWKELLTAGLFTMAVGLVLVEMFWRVEPDAYNYSDIKSGVGLFLAYASAVVNAAGATMLAAFLIKWGLRSRQSRTEQAPHVGSIESSAE